MRGISLIGAGAWRARGGSANQDPVWGSGDTGRSEKVIGPVSTVVEFVAACLSPPSDGDPPGVTASRSCQSHDARVFFSDVRVEFGFVCTARTSSYYITKVLDI